MSTSTTPAGESLEGFSIVDAIGALLRYRRLVVGVAVIIGALAGTWVLLRPRTYTARASFTPQATRSELGALGSLAAQFGVTAATADGNQSPAFYADVVRSRVVLESLVRLPVRFVWRGKGYAGTYADFLPTHHLDSLHKVAAAVLSLHDAITADVDTKTGIVQLATKTRYPALSAILTDSALARLNSFNVQNRRSQAAAQRQFLEQRITAVAGELQAAEDDLRDFAQRNRDLRNSPALLIEQDRLNRVVSLRSGVYQSLAQALEQAKLEEIRDTPLLTVIDEPEAPVQPDPRGLIATTLAGFFAGLFLGAIAALVRQSIRINRESRADTFAELSLQMTATKADLRRLVWPFKEQPAPPPHM